MKNVLDNVNDPKDLDGLNIGDKQILAKNIRDLLLDVTSKTGGHLASNLGVVELTIALHSVFETPKDKIVWDVGHQIYPHKILTGRKDKMHTLRQLDGVSGFPKNCESESDCFDTGHSSTSISVALGMARARDILKEDYSVLALIGDGALTGGMALEALNDAGCSGTKMTVILNDNEMSISKNVGGVPMLLSKIRSKRLYIRSNNAVKRFTNKLPLIGKPITNLAHYIKRTVKHMIIKNMYFEDIGFTYLGPVDGHDIEKLEKILRLSKKVDGPVLVHVMTKKGKGYEIAENTPAKFHGVSSFNIETGEPLKSGDKDYSAVFGSKLVELAKRDEKIVAITAAMTDGTGLAEFASEFPERLFDIGIAEGHAVRASSRNGESGTETSVCCIFFFLTKRI